MLGHVFRSVQQLRLRTIEAVEAIAAFERFAGPTHPFSFHGEDYLHKMLVDVSFLDDVECLQDRMSYHSAGDDPFLRSLT